MKTLTKTNDKPTKGLVFAMIALAALLIALAPPAGAEGPDEIVQGFEKPLVFEAPDFGVLIPTLGATVSVDCSNEDPIHVEVGNATNFSTNIVVSIDGDDVSGLVPVNAHNAFQRHYPAIENKLAHVVVTAGANELADELLKVNCVASDPWFEFIANCDVGQAWVELGNNGPDVAVMGVHYADLPHAGGEVGAGESSIQPLAVQPNEFADFSIEVDGEAIYTEGYFFDCPLPVEPEPVEPELVEEDTAAEVKPEAPAETPVHADETDDVEDEPVKTEVIEGVGDADELAVAGGLEVGGASNTTTAVIVGLLLALGIAMVVGSAAALRARR